VSGLSNGRGSRHLKAENRRAFELRRSLRDGGISSLHTAAKIRRAPFHDRVLSDARWGWSFTCVTPAIPLWRMQVACGATRATVSSKLPKERAERLPCQVSGKNSRHVAVRSLHPLQLNLNRKMPSRKVPAYQQKNTSSSSCDIMGLFPLDAARCRSRLATHMPDQAFGSIVGKWFQRSSFENAERPASARLAQRHSFQGSISDTYSCK